MQGAGWRPAQRGMRGALVSAETGMGDAGASSEEMRLLRIGGAVSFSLIVVNCWNGEFARAQTGRAA